LKQLIFVLVFLIPSTAFSQHRVARPQDCLTEQGEPFTIECSDEKPENCSQYVCQYIPAPFKGYLLTGNLMGDLILGKKNAEDKAKKDLSTQKKKYDEKLRYQAEVNKNNLDLSKDKVAMWKEQAEANQPHWYNHPGLWIGVGVIGTALLAIGLTFGLEKANQVNTVQLAQ